MCVALAGPALAGKLKLKVGEAPPPLTWTTLEEESLDWDELRQDRPLVMVFWATWCMSCKKEWPHLIELIEEFEESPLPPVWASASLGESADKVAKTVAKRELPGIALVDPKEKNGKALGIDFIPTVCVLDTEGNVAYVGNPKIKKLREILASLTSPPPESETP